MPTRSFTLSATVDAPPESAIAFLMQLDRHHGLHPYLQSAEVVAEGVAGDGPWWDWRVVERPTVWGIPYTMRFPARMTRLSAGSMRGDVVAAPGCRLQTVTTAVPTADGTVVEETTTVTAPGPVIGYMTKHARSAHARTFGRLPAELATPA
ncbi:hypothetical protein [Microbacterium sp. NPDC058389]|uniref:hypothetical protein n=1 Tax=Microbacterium sp. NPDC058389 TaxID=3346475 RepID=UPI00365933D0